MHAQALGHELAGLGKDSLCVQPLGDDGSDNGSGSWSEVDLAFALPRGSNPAVCSPGSAAPVPRKAPGVLLQPPRGSPPAEDDGEEGEDDWEAWPEESTLRRARRPASSTGRPAKRIKRPGSGALVDKGKRPRAAECSGGGGGDNAALPGPAALDCRPVHGERVETAPPCDHQGIPEQARHNCAAIYVNG